MIIVKWGNDLAALAADLFANLAAQPQAAQPAAVFRSRACIVVPNRIMQVWLQHQYLYQDQDQPEPRVLTNCDFPLLNVFVNDWLYRMDHGGESRDPLAHPFSVEAMRWRIYRLLADPDVCDKIMTQPPAASRDAAGLADQRRFKLAGRLARLYDEYMVYRPDMLTNWEQNKIRGVPEELAWEPRLWQNLTAGEDRGRTYLAAFRRMANKDGLKTIGIGEYYSRIHVFGVSMMPRVYLWFFQQLSHVLDVSLFLFNPCRTEWFSAMTPRDMVRAGVSRLRLEAADEEQTEVLETPNPLLGALGKGCREFLAEVLDVTEGQAEANPRFGDPTQDTLLHRLQAGILLNEGASPTDPCCGKAGDTSVQIHVCHNPLRELEILRDHILRWFATMPGLQPRDIQVQVSDMAAYGPYIDAVFATQAKLVATAIPYTIADRVLAGESQAAEAFMGLLHLPDSRLAAPEIFALLRYEGIGRTFGFEPEDVARLAEWVEAAGIRWGYDAGQRQAITGVDFTDFTTWQRGLDRLLLGYALGPDPADEPSTADGPPLPCDRVEGDDAVMLGRLVRFVNCLRQAAALGEEPRTPGKWKDVLEDIVDTFFTSTNDNYRDIVILRGAVAALAQSAEAAGFHGELPFRVVRDFLAGHLQGASGGDDMLGNAVMFSALRPGSSVPRRIMCLLGMGDGHFPRTDNRAAYDLFRVTRKIGDRSLRIEGRQAWLEALVSARDTLYISHVGFDPEDQKPIPPSVLVEELREQATATPGGGRILEVQHKLRAFDPAYFQTDRHELFSYSMSNFEAARTLLDHTGKQARAGNTQADADAATATGGTPTAGLGSGVTAGARSLTEADVKAAGEIELDDVIRFFKNPAQWYFKEILGADLELKADAALGDVEAFEPGGLEAFKINQAMVEALVGDGFPMDQTSAMTATRRNLLEAGLAPLEHWGEEWFREQWEVIQKLLSADVEGLGPLGAALRKQQASKGKPVFASLTLAGAQVTVTGTVAAFAADEGQASVAVDFRCANPKADTKLASWIRHVFACAAGQPETRYLIAGKDMDKKDATEVLNFPSLAPEVAQVILVNLVAVYLAGRNAIPSFTPATAYEYVDKRRNLKPKKKQPPPTDDERHDAGLKAARNAWYSTNDGFGKRDDRDPYYFRAFGPDGPFENEKRFADLAESLWTPLFDNQSVLKLQNPTGGETKAGIGRDGDTIEDEAGGAA